MAWLFKEKWFWVIITGAILIFTLSLIIIWVILALPPTLRVVATLALIIGWGVVAGYKDWIISRHQEESKKK